MITINIRKYIQILITLSLILAVVYVFYDYNKRATEKNELKDNLSGEQIYDEDMNPISYGMNVGEMIYNFDFVDFETNETHNISEFFGQKIYLFFWASWCPHCKNAAIELQKLQEENHDIKIIGINLADTELDKEGPLQFIEDVGITYMNGQAEDEMYKLFQIESTPTSLFINSNGIIELGVVGGLTRDMILNEFDKFD